MTRQILEVKRMSNADLWKHLFRATSEMQRAGIGELMHGERKALATRAHECATELYKRGEQLKLDARWGTESRQR